MTKVKITRALHDALAPAVEAGRAWSDLLEALLFEIPDESMEAFTTMADPVDVEVSGLVGDLMVQISEAFGMTPLGLSVLMGKILTKTFEMQARFEKLEEGP